MTKHISVCLHTCFGYCKDHKASLNNPVYHFGDQYSPEEVLQDETGCCFHLHSVCTCSEVLSPGLSVQMAARCDFELPAPLFVSFIFGTCESTGGSKLGNHVLPGFIAGVWGPIPANKTSPVLFGIAVGDRYLYWELEFDAVMWAGLHWYR